MRYCSLLLYFHCKFVVHFVQIIKKYHIMREKLRMIRTAKGFTQKQIANAICTTDSNYCRKENGDVKIFNEEWEKIAELLKVPIEDIYEEEKVIMFNQNHTTGEISILYSKYHITQEALIGNLQDYISILKKENEFLKEELLKYKK